MFEFDELEAADWQVLHMPCQWFFWLYWAEVATNPFVPCRSIVRILICRLQRFSCATDTAKVISPKGTGHKH